MNLYKRIFKLIFIIYLTFTILVNTFSLAFPKRVSKKSKALLHIPKSQTSNKGGRVVLLEEPQDSFDARIALIKSATKKLDIVYHSFQYGETLKVFLMEVLNAANRGVRVRILLDGKVGLINHKAKKLMNYLLTHKNIEYCRYNKLSLLKPWGWNMLLHDKFINADDQYLIIGGRNIGDKYFANNEYKGKITYDRDVMIYHKRKGIKIFNDINVYMNSLWYHKDSKIVKSKMERKRYIRFEQEWKEEVKHFYNHNRSVFKATLKAYKKHSYPADQIVLLHNPISTHEKKEPWLAYQLRKLIHTAKKKVIIQTPYMSGNAFLLELLKDKPKNISYEIITNSLASTPNILAFSNYYSYRKRFANTDADIYEYQSLSSIHGKSVILDDDTSIIGSFNLDDRSIHLDTETMVVIKSEAFTQMFKTKLNRIKSECLHLENDSTYGKSENKALRVSPIKKLVIYVVSIFTRIFQYLI